MFRFIAQIATRLILFTALWVMLAAGISRILQPPMPPLLYTQDRALYTVASECPSFFLGCTIQGRKVLDGLYSFPVASFSPDGRYVAVHLQSFWAFYPVDCLLENPDCSPVILDPSINDVRPAWGVDSSVILFIDSSAKNILVFSRTCWDGSPKADCFRQTIPLSTNRLVRQPDWSADGRFLVLSERRPPGLLIFDTNCLGDPAGCVGYQREWLAQQFTGTSWPSFSPDAKSILYTADPSPNGIQESLFLMDVQTGQSRPLAADIGVSLYPDWTPDGRYIVFSSYQVPRSRDAKLYLIDFSRNITRLFLHMPEQNLYFPVWMTR